MREVSPHWGGERKTSIATHGSMWYIFLPSAVCSYIGEYSEDFTDLTGYGRLGDFVGINYGNA